MMKAVGAIAFGILIMVSVLVSPICGEIIQIGISGEVTEISDYARGELFGGNVQIGDTVTGWYAYDTDTWDSVSGSDIGDYWQDEWPCGIMLQVDTLTFQSDPGNVKFLIGIGNDYSGQKRDNYWLYSYSNLSVNERTDVVGIELSLYDPTGTALSSDDLPTEVPVLADWDTATLRVDASIDGGCSGTILAAEVTDVWLIPEPATLALFGFGGLAVLRRQRR